MKLSIIVPIYNAETYLETCLNSIQACPFSDMECILVNDGSVDRSAEICRQYVKKDSRFILLEQENGGVSTARNHGLECAKGEWIFFLDSDDCLVEDAWKKLEKVISAEMADYIAFSYITLEEDGRTKKQFYSIEDMESRSLEDAERLVFASSEMNTCWGKLFSLQIIKNYHIQFLEGLPIGEDYLFVAEYFSHCSSSMISNEAILYYLQRPDSAMHKYNMEQRIGFMKQLYSYNLQAVEKIGKETLKQNFYQYYFRVLTNLFLVYARELDFPKLREAYQTALIDQIVLEIMEHTICEALPSSMKKMEFVLMKKKKIRMLVFYFKCKARVG